MKTKKLFGLTLLFIAATLLTACGGGSGTTNKTPLEITKELCSYFEKGDYETCLKKQMEYLIDDGNKLTGKQLQDFIQDAVKLFTEESDKGGGYKKIEIKEDEENNDSIAYIHMFCQYNDDSYFENWYTFVKTERGWRIKNVGNR